MKRLVVWMALVAAACGGRTTGGDGETGSSGDEGTGESGQTSISSTSTTGTAGEDSDEGTFTETTCGGFACGDPDLPNPVSCDPVEQDCAEGEKCTAYGTQPGTCCDAHQCVDIIGDKELWEPCMRADGNDDCAGGLFCVTPDAAAEGKGLCFGFCDAQTGEGCSEKWGLEDAYCAPRYSGFVPVCEATCNPLKDDCEDPLGCTLFGGSTWVCSVLGDLADGDACDWSPACSEGNVCVDGTRLEDCDDPGCCSSVCDVSMFDTECDGPGEVCIPYFEAGIPPPGLEDVGICYKPD